MNLFKKLLIFISLSFLVASCGILDHTSPNDIEVADAITSVEGAESALLGCYSALQNRAYYGGQYLLMGEALADNATTGGYQIISLNQLSERAVTPVNQYVSEAWIAIYRVVANTNYLLAAIPKLKGDAIKLQKIEGQAQVIRALAHFDALRYFGEHWNTNSPNGIPVVKTVQTINDQPARASVADCYKFIIDELLAAAPKLNTNDPEAVQFINSFTAQALLARAYLYQGNKNAAAAAADKVLANRSFYTLFDSKDYPSVFSSRATAESIFELAFDTQNRSEYNGFTYARPEAVRPELFYVASKSLDDFFKTRPTDVRAQLLDFNPANNDNSIVPDGRTQKYRGEVSRDNPAYILRVAEMHLIRAEALGRLGGGLDVLNGLREKRGLGKITPGEVTTDASFLKFILDERRAEFNFEGHRYFDLARTRQYKTQTGAADFRSILPIPAREITASGGKLIQNTGY
jgi:hypothetical protein